MVKSIPRISARALQRLSIWMPSSSTRSTRASPMTTCRPPAARTSRSKTASRPTTVSAVTDPPGPGAGAQRRPATPPTLSPPGQSSRTAVAAGGHPRRTGETGERANGPRTRPRLGEVSPTYPGPQRCPSPQPPLLQRLLQLRARHRRGALDPRIACSRSSALLASPGWSPMGSARLVMNASARAARRESLRRSRMPGKTLDFSSSTWCITASTTFVEPDDGMRHAQEVHLMKSGKAFPGTCSPPTAS